MRSAWVLGYQLVTIMPEGELLTFRGIITVQGQFGPSNGITEGGNNG